MNEVQCVRPKAQRKKSSQGKSLLSKKKPTSGSGESAVVHFVQLDFLRFGDELGMSDDDPVVVRTVETLSVVEGDDSTLVQEKEARSSGGILFR
ncbi:MAG: hypothetical protein AM325_008285 [Candidatus Thorarchaeota archaeon SMTZ1-45]|nr:MAG: hypothetical protein AM325_10005 [Candidatus Thorarchaeota archaeon SMTZ1-45]